ncbi:hypothetical protein H0178_06565 [Cytobacillus firmus]|nr:hypothetical protein [Cytobacillus firmus]
MLTFIIICAVIGLIMIGFGIFTYLQGEGNFIVGFCGIWIIGLSIMAFFIDKNNNQQIEELKHEIVQSEKINKENEDERIEVLSRKLNISKDEIILEKESVNTYNAKTSIGEFYVQYNENYSEIEKLFENKEK